jgi:hypothetical protein
MDLSQGWKNIFFRKKEGRQRCKKIEEQKNKNQAWFFKYFFGNAYTIFKNKNCFNGVYG